MVQGVSAMNYRDRPAGRLEAQAGTGPTGGDDGAERADLRGWKRDVGEADDSRNGGGDGVHGVFDKLSSRKLKTRQGHQPGKLTCKFTLPTL